MSNNPSEKTSKLRNLMEKKDMQPIVYMVALSCSAVLTILAVGFFVTGKFGQVSFLVMLALAIVVGFGIVWGVKKFWFRLGPAEVGLDTLKEEIDTFSKQKLKEIQTDVNLHKESITALLKKASESGQRLSEHGQSINNLIKQATQVESSLQEVIEAARPPVLQLHAKASEQGVDGIVKVFSLFPDKNQSLGLVSVVAKIIPDITNSKILSMSNKNKGFVISTPNAKLLDGNQTAAMLYRPPVPVPIQIEIVVSEPCKIFVGSSYVVEPNEFVIELPPNKSQQSKP